MRQSQLRGRDRLAALQQHNADTDDAMGLQRHRFAKLADPAAATRAVSAFNLFQTPPDLADRVVSMLGDRAGDRVLEPSAGLGRLYRSLRKSHAICHVTMVELAAECCGELYRAIERDPSARLVQGDFLCQSPDVLGVFSGIVMNPPFKMGRDVTHIQHARKFLKPGGRLVSLCAVGARRNVLRQDCSHWIDLEPGAFASEGTRVEAAIVVFDH